MPRSKRDAAGGGAGCRSAASTSPPDMQLSSKRRLLAQRKFAQGVVTPWSASGGASAESARRQRSPARASPSPPASPLQDGDSAACLPSTEDFITFLCFRGTDRMPAHLEKFNVAPTSFRRSRRSSGLQTTKRHSSVSNLEKRMSGVQSASVSSNRTTRTDAARTEPFKLNAVMRASSRNLSVPSPLQGKSLPSGPSACSVGPMKRNQLAARAPVTAAVRRPPELRGSRPAPTSGGQPPALKRARIVLRKLGAHSGLAAARCRQKRGAQQLQRNKKLPTGKQLTAGSRAAANSAVAEARLRAKTAADKRARMLKRLAVSATLRYPSSGPAIKLSAALKHRPFARLTRAQINRGGRRPQLSSSRAADRRSSVQPADAGSPSARGCDVKVDSVPTTPTRSKSAAVDRTSVGSSTPSAGTSSSASIVSRALKQTPSKSLSLQGRMIGSASTSRSGSNSVFENSVRRSWESTSSSGLQRDASSLQHASGPGSSSQSCQPRRRVFSPTRRERSLPAPVPADDDGIQRPRVALASRSKSRYWFWVEERVPDSSDDGGDGEQESKEACDATVKTLRDGTVLREDSLAAGDVAQKPAAVVQSSAKPNRTQLSFAAVVRGNPSKTAFTEHTRAGKDVKEDKRKLSADAKLTDSKEEDRRLTKDVTDGCSYVRETRSGRSSIGSATAHSPGKSVDKDNMDVSTTSHTSVVDRKKKRCTAGDNVESLTDLEPSSETSECPVKVKRDDAEVNSRCLRIGSVKRIISRPDKMVKTMMKERLSRKYRNLALSNSRSSGRVGRKALSQSEDDGDGSSSGKSADLEERSLSCDNVPLTQCRSLRRGGGGRLPRDSGLQTGQNCGGDGVEVVQRGGSACSIPGAVRKRAFVPSADTSSDEEPPLASLLPPRRHVKSLSKSSSSSSCDEEHSARTRASRQRAQRLQPLVPRSSGNDTSATVSGSKNEKQQSRRLATGLKVETGNGIRSFKTLRSRVRRLDVSSSEESTRRAPLKKRRRQLNRQRNVSSSNDSSNNINEMQNVKLANRTARSPPVAAASVTATSPVKPRRTLRKRSQAFFSYDLIASDSEDDDCGSTGSFERIRASAAPSKTSVSVAPRQISAETTALDRVETVEITAVFSHQSGENEGKHLESVAVEIKDESTGDHEKDKPKCLESENQLDNSQALLDSESPPNEARDDSKSSLINIALADDTDKITTSSIQTDAPTTAVHSFPRETVQCRGADTLACATGSIGKAAVSVSTTVVTSSPRKDAAVADPKCKSHKKRSFSRASGSGFLSKLKESAQRRMAELAERRLIAAADAAGRNGRSSTSGVYDFDPSDVPASLSSKAAKGSSTDTVVERGPDPPLEINEPLIKNPADAAVVVTASPSTPETPTVSAFSALTSQPCLSSTEKATCAIAVQVNMDDETAVRPAAAPPPVPVPVPTPVQSGFALLSSQRVYVPVPLIRPTPYQTGPSAAGLQLVSVTGARCSVAPRYTHQMQYQLGGAGSMYAASLAPPPVTFATGPAFPSLQLPTHSVAEPVYSCSKRPLLAPAPGPMVAGAAHLSSPIRPVHMHPGGAHTTTLLTAAGAAAWWPNAAPPAAAYYQSPTLIRLPTVAPTVLSAAYGATTILGSASAVQMQATQHPGNLTLMTPSLSGVSALGVRTTSLRLLAPSHPPPAPQPRVSILNMPPVASSVFSTTSRPVGTSMAFHDASFIASAARSDVLACSPRSLPTSLQSSPLRKRSTEGVAVRTTECNVIKSAASLLTIPAEHTSPLSTVCDPPTVPAGGLTGDLERSPSITDLTIDLSPGPDLPQSNIDCRVSVSEESDRLSSDGKMSEGKERVEQAEASQHPSSLGDTMKRHLICDALPSRLTASTAGRIVKQEPSLPLTSDQLPVSQFISSSPSVSFPISVPSRRYTTPKSISASEPALSSAMSASSAQPSTYKSPSGFKQTGSLQTDVVPVIPSRSACTRGPASPGTSPVVPERPGSSSSTLALSNSLPSSGASIIFQRDSGSSGRAATATVSSGTSTKTVKRTEVFLAPVITPATHRSGFDANAVTAPTATASFSPLTGITSSGAGTVASPPAKKSVSPKIRSRVLPFTSPAVSPRQSKSPSDLRKIGSPKILQLDATNSFTASSSPNDQGTVGNLSVSVKALERPSLAGRSPRVLLPGFQSLSSQSVVEESHPKLMKALPAFGSIFLPDENMEDLSVPEFTINLNGKSSKGKFPSQKSLFNANGKTNGKGTVPNVSKTSSQVGCTGTGKSEKHSTLASACNDAGTSSTENGVADPSVHTAANKCIAQVPPLPAVLTEIKQELSVPSPPAAGALPVKIDPDSDVSPKTAGTSSEPGVCDNTRALDRTQKAAASKIPPSKAIRQPDSPASSASERDSPAVRGEMPPSSSRTVKESQQPKKKNPRGVEKVSARCSDDNNDRGTPSSHDEESAVSMAQSLSEVPVFRPSQKQFADPLLYIESIRPQAEKYGLCRIIPPVGFKPECRVDDDMRFVAYNHYVHKVFNRWGPNFRELLAIRRYLEQQQIDMEDIPLIGGLELDLPQLYQSVQELGGLNEVIVADRWGAVAERMGLQRGAQAAKLDQIYCKYLIGYTALTNDERKRLRNEVEIDWRRRQRDDVMGRHDEDDQSEDEDDATECIVKGKTTSLSGFYRVARNLTSTWYKDKSTSPAKVEEDYWKVVSERQRHLCVYSGSIDCGVQGYGFVCDKKSSTSRLAWNLKVLSSNPLSVLRSMGQVMGLTVPTLHMAMTFTTGCWYSDPHELPWIEYLHTGSSKIWYSIPASAGELFRAQMSDIMPSYVRSQPVWLPSDTAMVPPDVLLERGVPVWRTVQRPGEFVVAMSGAYTAYIGTGYTLSESVFYADAEWLDAAPHVFQKLMASREPGMFSLEQLILGVCSDCRAPLDTLLRCRPLLDQIIQTEQLAIQRAKQLGVTKESRLSSAKSSRAKKSHSADDGDERECETCNCSIYTCMVEHVDEELFYCMQDAAQLIQDEQISANDLRLLYMYSQEEYTQLLLQMDERILEMTSNPEVAKKKR